MNTKTAIQPRKNWKASEIRKLPAKQRSSILKAAAAMAEEDYRIDASLTAFDAFGKRDLHGESFNANTRRSRVIVP